MNHSPDCHGFADRLLAFIRQPESGCFVELALALFRLQFAQNAPYRSLCQGRRVTPDSVADWTQIPAAPTAAFKELELTSLPPADRMRVFHSSGTTLQRASRHFHNAESLAIYEASMLPWFQAHMLPEQGWRADYGTRLDFICLTPTPDAAPHSSLVHMLDVAQREFGGCGSLFSGGVDEGGAWRLDVPLAFASLRSAAAAARPIAILGTAFSFVHLLDLCVDTQVRFALPPGSRVMETGGYKGRSRSLPMPELHALITEHLGVLPSHIVREYGMSELSSQAYDRVASDDSQLSTPSPRRFHFPPWTRARIVSPETGREVAEGETGLLQVFDLANVRSVLAVQTEDLAVRRGDGFELLGRAALAEPRGCSLMAA